MTTIVRARMWGILCIVLALAGGTAACGDSPASPSGPTLTGNWAGSFTGNVVEGDASAEFTQNGANVDGNWTAPMPEALMNVAPAGIALAGPVTGTVDGTTAELEFAFVEAFHAFLGTPDCALAVSVSSFSETTLTATWETNASCPPNINDSGTLTLMRQ